MDKTKNKIENKDFLFSAVLVALYFAIIVLPSFNILGKLMLFVFIIWTAYLFIDVIRRFIQKSWNDINKLVLILSPLLLVPVLRNTWCNLTNKTCYLDVIPSTHYIKAFSIIAASAIIMKAIIDKNKITKWLTSLSIFCIVLITIVFGNSSIYGFTNIGELLINALFKTNEIAAIFGNLLTGFLWYGIYAFFGARNKK